MKRKWTTLLIAAATMSPAFAADIPAVKDRDPNPLTSPRFPVTAVTVANFSPMASLGLTQEAVEGFLSERLAALAAENAAGASGFTAAELDEVGKWLNAAGVHRDGAALSAREAADLVGLIREQKMRRGVSVVELERLAAELGEFYRRHGLPLATGYVPMQSVNDGRVVLAVEPGLLERVELTGKSRYPSRLIEHAFADQIGAPVEHRRVEEALYQVSALPGLTTESRFTAGESVGGSKLTMNVRGERRIAGSVRIDNHGNEQSGETRALGELDWYNPTGYGDAFAIGAIGANDPDKTAYGYAQYTRPLGSLRTVGHVRVSTGAFDWQESSTRVDGDNFVAELGFRRELRHSRIASLGVDGALGWQRLALEPEDAVDIEEQRVALASFGLNGRRVSDPHELVANGRIGVDVGQYLDGEPDSATFARLSIDSDVWTLIGIPGFAEPQRLGLRMTGQAATTALPGTLQLGLGGAARVAAFDPALVSVDDGIHMGLDLRLKPEFMRWGEIRLFADAAYGEQKRQYEEDLWAYLSDVGLGWMVSLPAGLRSELRWSLPINARGEDDSIDDDGARWLWMVTYEPEASP